MKSLPPLHLVSLLIVALTGLTWAPGSSAATPGSRAGMAELGDPYVPPRVKAAARMHALAAGPVLATSGAHLQAQALGKLEKKFNQADVDHSGLVTKAQARQAGFGYVVNHFEQIDARHRGSITFDDLKQFMRANGANF
jgi:hypothetical protein